MRLGNDTKTRVKRIIRDAVALHPMISLRELQQVLSSRKIRIGNLNSLSKLRKEITEDALSEVDEKAMNEKIALVKERNRVITEKLFRIAFWDSDRAEPGTRPPSYSEQIAAMTTIVKMDIAIFRAELDFGMFKKKPLTKEEIRKLRNKPLSSEHRKDIERAMRNFGLIK